MVEILRTARKMNKSIVEKIEEFVRLNVLWYKRIVG